ncbi:MAG TPA: hypothetical protein VH765_01635 [Xanthobacteraceae bacterium]|jgi:hypothetical protein
MRSFLTATLLLAMSGSAIAQSCVTAGNAVYCTNGVTGQRFGTGTFWSDGLVSHQNRQRLGNPVTYFSNGVTAQQFGNTQYFSDGRTCTRFGNTVFCN